MTYIKKILYTYNIFPVKSFPFGYSYLVLYFFVFNSRPSRYYKQSIEMADVKRLVFSILTFLEDQKKTGHLDDEQVESLEGKL